MHLVETWSQCCSGYENLANQRFVRLRQDEWSRRVVASGQSCPRVRWPLSSPCVQ